MGWRNSYVKILINCLFQYNNLVTIFKLKYQKHQQLNIKLYLNLDSNKQFYNFRYLSNNYYTKLKEYKHLINY